MNIVEFVETAYDLKLTEYQKALLNFYSSLPEGSTVVMSRKGPILIDKNGIKIIGG